MTMPIDEDRITQLRRQLDEVLEGLGRIARIRASVAGSIQHLRGVDCEDAGRWRGGVRDLVVRSDGWGAYASLGLMDAAASRAGQYLGRLDGLHDGLLEKLFRLRVQIDTLQRGGVPDPAFFEQALNECNYQKRRK